MQHTANISNCDANKIGIVKDIMDNLVAIDPADYAG